MILGRGMEHFYTPEEVSIDFHRNMYICALLGTGRTTFEFGYDLVDGRFWFHDAHRVDFYGMYIQTSFGFEPYRVMLGGIEVGGYTRFVDAWWGLHDIRNSVMLEARHLRYYRRPHSGRCTECDKGL